MKIKKLLSGIAIVSVILVAGCKKDNSSDTTVIPVQPQYLLQYQLPVHQFLPFLRAQQLPIQEQHQLQATLD